MFVKRRPMFHFRLICVREGTALIEGIHKILQEIFGLVSTTVCGIPMKEEAHSGQSVNYDVEMLHPMSAHAELHSLGLLGAGSKMMDSPSLHEHLFTSVRLKWCTASPKLKSDIFPLLQHSVPITPAHVNLRQSMCLTSFITNGKSVLLEIFPDAYQGQGEPKLTPNLHQKLISHYLSRDLEGALILHCVAVGQKATLSGKMSSELVYGAQHCSAELANKLNRPTFIQIIKSAQLFPTGKETFKLIEEVDEEETKEQNDEGIRSRLMRRERVKKGKKDYDRHLMNVQRLLTYGSTFSLINSFVYNASEKFEPLLSIIAKPNISDDQFAQCKTKIFSLVSKRGKEPLTDKVFKCKLLSTGRSDTAPKDELYRIAFDELSKVLFRFSHISEAHKALLTLFCDLSGVRQPFQKRKCEFDDAEKDLHVSAKKSKKALWDPDEKVNIYDWLRKRYEQEYWGSWKGDFEGRKKYGDNAQEFLYPNLKLPAGQQKYAGTGGAGPIE